MINVETLGLVSMSKLVPWYHCIKTLPFYSEFHLCSTGESSSDFGTRGGDSGTLVFLKENGRYLSIAFAFA